MAPKSSIWGNFCQFLPMNKDNLRTLQDFDTKLGTIMHLDILHILAVPFLP